MDVAPAHWMGAIGSGLDADFREVLPPERAHLVALDGFARQGKRRRVRQGQPQGLLLDLRLGLLVQLAAHPLFAGGLAGADQLVQAGSQ